MATALSHLDPDMLAQLQGLELRARYVVDAYLAGRHRSRYRGQSVEFTEHREYSLGDDLRYVDWKVFGKTDKVYLKQFEAESNLVSYLLVDISESMRYGSAAAHLTKLEYAQCLSAALGYIVLRQRDRVSLATFDNVIRDFVRESDNPANLQQMVHVLDRAEAKEKSDVGKVLHEASQRWRRRGVVVVVSDLLEDSGSLISGLKHLRFQRHEVILLQLLDPAELEFPFRSTTLFEGLESQADLLAETRTVRRAYLAAMDKFLNRIEDGCRRLGVAYHLVRTDEMIDLVLQRVLSSRGAHRG